MSTLDKKKHCSLGSIEFGKNQVKAEYRLVVKSGAIMRKSTKEGSKNWFYVPRDRITRSIQERVSVCDAKDKKQNKFKRRVLVVNAKSKSKSKSRVRVKVARKTPEQPVKTKISVAHKRQALEQNKIITKLKKINRQMMDARELRSFYNKGYEFPEWAIEKSYDNYTKIMKPVVVYYDKGANLVHVRRQARERQPVNIDDTLLFDTEKFAAKYGYEDSYYTRYYKDNKELAPNIAVYTPTYVEGRVEPIHVINSVRYVFSDKRQPDWKCLIRDNSIRQEDVSAVYARVFEKIYQCAIDHGCTCIAMPLIGTGSFASVYRSNPTQDSDGWSGRVAFLLHVWLPQFWKIWSRICKKHPAIRTVLMADSFEDNFELGHLNTFMNKKGITKKFSVIGSFPECLDKVDTAKTLIVNAWDPYSIPGNGNKKNKSLDGEIGRITNIAINGTGLTNTSMTYKSVP